MSWRCIRAGGKAGGQKNMTLQQLSSGGQGIVGIDGAAFGDPFRLGAKAPLVFLL